MRIEINSRGLTLVEGDITIRSTQAIVNAANPGLKGGGGVDGAIHKAGGPAILEECRRIVAKQGQLPAGKVVITTGGRLKARYVIHTVGPVWYGGDRGEAETLAACYSGCLRLAEDKNLTSISFPSISTGAYGYPKYRAARVAMWTVASFLKNEASSLKEVVFVLYDYNTYDTYQVALSELL